MIFFTIFVYKAPKTLKTKTQKMETVLKRPYFGSFLAQNDKKGHNMQYGKFFRIFMEVNFMCGLCRLFSGGNRSYREGEQFCNCYTRRREPEMNVYCASGRNAYPYNQASVCTEQRSCSCGRTCGCRENCNCR